MAKILLKYSLLSLLAVFSGCATRKTEALREWSEQSGLHRDLVLRHGDTLSQAMEFTIKSTLAERDLQALADTSEAWELDSMGIRIHIPSVQSIAPFSFTIRSPRMPANGESLRFQIAGGGGPDPVPPQVTIQRLEGVVGVPMLVAVHPESLSLILVGIPFDSAFTPALPPHSRIMARKAVHYRLSFDDRILEGEAHIVEYRYAATTIDEEREGL
jgi:hypothetical protein